VSYHIMWVLTLLFLCLFEVIHLCGWHVRCCAHHHPLSSSSAQQSLLNQGLLQKLLPAVPIPCSIPPISLPQLPGISHHTIFPSYFRPASLSSSFYHCNENSSCMAQFLHTNNMSCPFESIKFNVYYYITFLVRCVHQAKF